MLLLSAAWTLTFIVTAASVGQHACSYCLPTSTYIRIQATETVHLRTAVPAAEAKQPEDWDEEEDGVWEPPRIANPLCKDAPGCGEWTRPNKPNPAYKGKWSAPQIDNPEYKARRLPAAMARALSVGCRRPVSSVPSLIQLVPARNL